MCTSLSAVGGSTRQGDSPTATAVGVGIRREANMYTPRRSIRKAWLAMLGLALFASTGAAWADDPPDRVARLSFMRGDVSFQPAGGDDWTQATLNRPLGNGAKI